MLSDAQKHALTDLARRAVAAQVAGTPEPGPLAIDLPDASGAFVTIKRGGELRGCLGTLQCSRGLAAEVARCAADAASEDPRFPPVSSAELPELSVEVSVLGPLEPIDPVDAIGHHDRPSRARRRTRAATRPAAAAGRDRVGLDRRTVPPPDVREGRPPRRRLATRRAHLPLRCGSVRGMRVPRGSAGFRGVPRGSVPRGSAGFHGVRFRGVQFHGVRFRGVPGFGHEP